MSGEKKVISPSEYRKKIYNIQEVEAPSDSVFKIQRLSVFDFIEDGNADVPNSFLDFIKSKGSVNDLVKATKDEETNKFLNKILNTMILKGVVEPKVKIKFDKKNSEEVLYWGEIEEADQIFLFNAIIGTTSKKV